MLNTKATGPDQITVDVIGSKLISIAEEMGLLAIRAARSPNIRERHDCSAAILDIAGNTIAQAEHIPIHLGSMISFIPSIVGTFADNIHPGDVFISNDPHLGGSTHLPDVTVARPIFVDDRCVAFACLVAHHAEIGASFRIGADIYDEGVRIPIIKFVEQGVRNDAFLQLFLHNCRVPDERIGDLDAQIAAVALGDARFRELTDQYGLYVLLQAVKGSLAKTELQFRAVLEAVATGSQPRTARFVDTLDSWRSPDGQPPRIEVSLELSADAVRVDFTGTSPQYRGRFNTTLNAVRAAVYYTLRTALDPTLPANSGFFDQVEIIAPEGTLVNSIAPAGTLDRSDTCQRIVDALLGALAQILPNKIPAASNGSITGVSLVGPGRGGTFAYVEVIAGGAGALPDMDGQSAVQTHLTNTANTPAEVVEATYPLTIRRYEIRESSGGAGIYRGGDGLVREIVSDADGVSISIKGERMEHGPWGRNGGTAGAVLRFSCRRAGDAVARELTLSDSGTVLNRGDSLIIESAGGGGFGAPRTTPHDQKAGA